MDCSAEIIAMTTGRVDAEGNRQSAMEIVADCARVSNPANQGKPHSQLIKYLRE